MATSSREARRRKIAERGSDRLALITGRIQSFPSSSSQPHHAYTASLPELSLDDQKKQSHRSTQSSVPVHGEEDGEEDASGTTSPKYETSNESARNAAIGTTSRLKPQLQKYETSVDYLKTTPLDLDSKAPASMTLSSMDQNLSTSTVDAESRSEPQRHHSRIFTASRISSSVSASERMRLRCSIVIALIVVLSHLRFPLLGSNCFVGSIIAARPVYLILLTDVTLVLARLLFEKKGWSGKAQEEAIQQPSENGYGWAEGLGKALEMGLVLHKVIGAAFLDCSVYLVIVVCGLSLVLR